MTIEEIQKMDKDTLCKESTFDEIYGSLEAFTRAQLLNAATERAQELKILKSFQALNKAYKDVLKNLSKGDINSGGFANKTNWNYYGTGVEFNCGNWFCSDDGIYIQSMIGNQIACFHPIFPVQRLKNLEKKTEKIEIAFKRSGEQWEHITVDKDVIASSSKIVQLSKYGIAVTSENAKLLVRFLSEFENINDIGLINSTSKFGWDKSFNEFIPLDRTIKFDAESRFKELNDSLEPSGSVDIWMDLILQIRETTRIHYEPQLVMAGAFASVLIKPLNMLPFILNVFGGSGKGKTVALMLAASIWADPGENRYITDALSTQNAFEIREDILNNLPLMIDDFSKIQDRFDNGFQDLIYMLCSGRGKARSNIDLGLNETKTWANITISNMERPLIGDNVKGGAVNRVLDFKMDDGDIFENGNKVVSIVKGNYGWIGRKYIEIIKDIGLGEVKKMRKEQEDRIRAYAKENEIQPEDKQILSMSIILTADKLATDYIFKDDVYLPFEKCVNQLKCINDVQETRRAYEYIIDFVNSKHNNFYPDDNGDYRGDVYGFEKDGFININPRIFQQIAKEGNFSTKVFCDWAKENGILDCNQGGKTFTKVIRNNEKTNRYVSIKLPDEEEDFSTVQTFVDTGDMSDIPF